VAYSVSSERDAITVEQAAEKISGNPIAGQFEDCLGVRVAISRDPRQIRLHDLIIAATTAGSQTRVTDAV
jgi:hypothetical protein